MLGEKFDLDQTSPNIAKYNVSWMDFNGACLSKARENTVLHVLASTFTSSVPLRAPSQQIFETSARNALSSKCFMERVLIILRSFSSAPSNFRTQKTM